MRPLTAPTEIAERRSVPIAAKFCVVRDANCAEFKTAICSADRAFTSSVPIFESWKVVSPATAFREIAAILSELIATKDAVLSEATWLAVS